jgi:hypothetical protein
MSDRFAFWFAFGLTLAVGLLGLLGLLVLEDHLTGRTARPTTLPAPRPRAKPARPDPENPYPECHAVAAAIRAGLREGRDDPTFLNICWEGRYALGEDSAGPLNALDKHVASPKNRVAVVRVYYVTLNVTVDPFGIPEKHHACYLFCRDKPIAHFAVIEPWRRQ